MAGKSGIPSMELMIWMIWTSVISTQGGSVCRGGGAGERERSTELADKAVERGEGKEKRREGDTQRFTLATRTLTRALALHGA